MGPCRPCVDAGDNRPQRIGEVRKYPVLRVEAEQALCQRWRDNHDISAAHQLTGSYLRLVDKIAMDYRGCGLATGDLISEGYVGLMHAVCQFDPDRNMRFATYASWWVRAAILEYMLRNRTLVEMGTSASWRKLFLNLRSMHRHMREFHQGTLNSEDVGSVSDLLRAPEREIMRPNPRMASGDRSLPIPMDVDSHREWRTWLVNDDADDDQKSTLAECKVTEYRKSVLPSAPSDLIARQTDDRAWPRGTMKLRRV
jgi:RNA polymerase sigma-32 factor